MRAQARLKVQLEDFVDFAEIRPGSRASEQGGYEMRDGGAAMTAYVRMQFEEMFELERQEIRRALLRYCELDILAMVMIYEAWRELVYQGE